ncbi:MAG TPA: hypothetical protein VFE52_01000, partial [Devosia sp.]|nr:hypothetical protein [Devosia sp.]
MAEVDTADVIFDDASAPAPKTMLATVLPGAPTPVRSVVLTIGPPVLLVYLFCGVLVLLGLGTMAGEMNRFEAQRSAAAVDAALNGFLDGLAEAVSDEGTSNEAYLNAVVQPDPAWMDSAWGNAARLGTTFDEVMVTDSAGKILFGES